MTENIGVAVIGDVLDINTWSNTPYYFFQAGKEEKLFNQPWRLDVSRLNTPRVIWNTLRMLRGKGKGGYQYSKAFLDKAESMIDPSYFSSTVISFNQLFPRASTVRKAGGRIYYYIDATLEELFEADSYGINIPRDMKDYALKLEKENYHAASAVVSMGTWVQRSLKEFYQLPSTSVYTIMPGANLPTSIPIDVHHVSGRPGIDRSLVLGFIGKDWKRKGLPVLLEIRDALEAAGYKAKVKIIGNCPNELLSRNGVEYSGFIDKKNDVQRFVNEISSCDIGCLFSTSEALGISILEFLRIGTPVMGYAHQGASDTLIPGASLRFDIGDTVNAMTKHVIDVIQSTEKLQQLRAKANEVSTTLTWKNTAREWGKLIHAK